MKNFRPTASSIIKFIGSPFFFWCVAALLVLQAAWIALSGLYPMAFDEDFHLGLIRLYADHLSPFWGSQPPNSDAFGTVTRDPSYLYHYLMSFPYLMISYFTDNQTAQVLALRTINIGLFVWGLTLYRRLLLKSRASRAMVHLTLLVLVLIPVTPLLAAQINYDNLFLPLVAIVMLLALKFQRSLASPGLALKTGVQLLIVCLLTSLVKYPFLPIFLAVGIYSLIGLWRTYGSAGQIKQALAKGCRQLKRPVLVLLAAGLILSGGLFFERYGLNLIRYHTPIPQCHKVLSYDHCRHYGPWLRSYNYRHNPVQTSTDPLIFTQHWFYGMWLRSFFAVDGPTTRFQTRSPLVLPGLSAIIFASVGGAALLLAGRRLWSIYSKPAGYLFAAVTAVYVGALWWAEYGGFRATGRPSAINGRYLLVVLPFVILFMMLAVKQLLSGRIKLQLAVLTIVMLCLVWGGGALTYILRSNDAWYWPDTPLTGANHVVKQMLGPVMPGYDQPTQFLH
jgi:hypothetical protein